jgi:hypothetical protein
MSFVIQIAAVAPNDTEVLSVRDTDTTLYFRSIKQQQFYDEVDDKLDTYIFALHPDFIPKLIKAKIEKIISASKQAQKVTLHDVVIAPRLSRFVIGANIVLDIRYRGKLIGSFDPDFKLRTIKRQRLSKKFVRSTKK